MSETSSILGLPFIAPSQAQKHVTHNEAIEALDLVVQLVVEDFETNAPPAVPLEGRVYALGAVPEGIWAGHAHELATWRATAWHFVMPVEGWRAYGRSEGEVRVWSGGEWRLSRGETENLGGLGIGIQSDALNRLAVRSAATLLTHDGAGHQLKINKATSGDTASLLFQSNWSGRAEMGLMGEDGFAIKLSPDGNQWSTALSFDGETGQASGAAIQSDEADATPGKIMQVGAFGLGGVTGKLHSGDDCDAISLSGYWGTGGVSDMPANVPLPDAIFAGHHVQNDSTQAFQMFGSLSGADQSVYWRGKNNAWSEWSRLYDSHNILGVVAEAGGNPTGAVIERGANVNGAYVRFADGTQICVCDVSGIDVDVATGALFRSATIAVTLPAQLISGVNGVMWIGNAVPEEDIWGAGRIIGASDGAFRLYSTVARTGASVSAVVIGRWF